MAEIEVIARVLVVQHEKILLCKTNKECFFFLPGGHVEFGESAEMTVVREMQEEATATVHDLKHIGIFENSYGTGEECHHEVNILYSGTMIDEHVVSAEAHISFEWIPVAQFETIKFLPKVFVPKILEFIQTGKPIFFSTISDS